ncbi:MAG TPA: 6-bladed beta-propeller [Candidatus Binatia bacterium]|nr:6-bladed beta-propeller [Candidatus Binatia bacterium]
MTRRNPRTQLRAWVGCLCCVLSLVSACASKWTVNTVHPEVALQWPFQPSKAKVTYVKSLTGFTPNMGSARLLQTIVFGTEDERNSFLAPVAVAVGPDGRIAVADMGRRSVHLYLPGSQRYLQLAATEQGGLVSPVEVTFDGESQLYVSDSSGRVVVFGADGKSKAVLEHAGGETLRRPTGLAYSPEKKLIYVVDTLANRVHAFATDGQFAFSFGERGDAPGRFNFPTRIFRSPAGELYVTDSLNFRIAIFTEEGKFVGSFGHHGDGSGDLAMPKGVAVDRDGIVYVVDGLFDNVQLFNRTGDFLLTVGQRGWNFGEFWLPSGAFISASDELYVCDTYNRRIQVFQIAEAYAGNAS